MLVVVNLSLKNDAKIREMAKTWVLICKYSARVPNTNMTGFRWFSNIAYFVNYFYVKFCHVRFMRMFSPYWSTFTHLISGDSPHSSVRILFTAFFSLFPDHQGTH